MRTKQGRTALATSSVTVDDSNEQTQVKPGQVTASNSTAAEMYLTISQTPKGRKFPVKYQLTKFNLINMVFFFDNALSSVIASIINYHCFLEKLKKLK